MKRILLLIVLYFLSGKFLVAQEITLDQAYVDKLKKYYANNQFDKSVRYVLKQIIQNETDPDEKIKYSDILITLSPEKTINENSKSDSTYNYLSAAYLQKGNALQLKGEFHEALDSFFKCMNFSNKEGDKELSAAVYVSIADTYSMIGNSDSAIKYYNEALILLRRVNDSISLASALLNLGDEYYSTGDYDKAMSNFKESGYLFDQLKYPIGKAYNMGNIGMVYAKLGKKDLAQSNMNSAITILEDIEDYYAISEYLNYMSDLYQEQNDFETALDYSNKSLELAKKYNLKDQISNANLQLSELMQNAGDYEEALNRYIQHDIYQDSIINLENVQKMANLEVEKKELEVENLEQKRKTQRIIIWSTVGVLFLTALLAYGQYRRHKFVKATNQVIAVEKQRSDDLLLNILPEDTAQELKDRGKVAAKKFPSTTVLFSDFVGFTSYAENLSPEKLVQTIDHYFSEFDKIMEKHGLEKIKTIGDAYMAVGGLSFDNVNQAKEIILAAKEMKAFVDKAKQDDFTDATFDIRIGVNTGPVVAGVVGFKKFAYDIWGDTVNVASRMESNSEPGRINVSEDTYKHIKSDFDCEYRGELNVKNRGQMKMYFINS